MMLNCDGIFLGVCTMSLVLFTLAFKPPSFNNSALKILVIMRIPFIGLARFPINDLQTQIFLIMHCHDKWTNCGGETVWRLQLPYLIYSGLK